MSKISSISSIKSSRIRNSYVQRNRVITGSSATVTPVDPVTPVTNELSQGSVNHLMSSDAFYDKLEALTKEYLNFYYQERNLKKSVDILEEDRDVTLTYIEELLERFNSASKALEGFDNQIYTNHSKDIKNILYEYERPLKNMGISIREGNQLEVDKAVFKARLVNSKDKLHQDFKPMREMVLELYKTFRNIKIPNKQVLDSQYDEFPDRDYGGIIMDQKS